MPNCFFIRAEIPEVGVITKRILPSHNLHTTRCADGCWVAMSKTNPTCCQGIYMWRLIVFSPVTAECLPAHIIRHDKHNIWLIAAAAFSTASALKLRITVPQITKQARSRRNIAATFLTHRNEPIKNSYWKDTTKSRLSMSCPVSQHSSWVLGVSEFSEIDDACVLLLVNLPTKTHEKKYSGTAVNIAQTKKVFRKNRLFPLWWDHPRTQT